VKNFFHLLSFDPVFSFGNPPFLLCLVHVGQLRERRCKSTYAAAVSWQTCHVFRNIQAKISQYIPGVEFSSRNMLAI